MGKRRVDGWVRVHVLLISVGVSVLGGRAAGHLTPYPHFHSCGLPHFLCSVPLALCLALAGPFMIIWE